MENLKRAPIICLVSAVAAMGLVTLSLTQSQAQGIITGPYKVSVATNPVVVPTGPASLKIYITRLDGKPDTGLTITARAQMPGMPMGEQFEPAYPVRHTPGLYIAPATFGMAGLYNAKVRIVGPLGDATANVRLITGRSTAGNLPSAALLAAATTQGNPGFPWSIAIACVVVTAVLVIGLRRTRLGSSAARAIPAGLLLMAALFASRWTVNKFEQPGHMSVLDAQSMDMSSSTMPVGQAPVAVETASFAAVTGSQRLSATVVPFTDQTISARVPGTIVSLPVYPGQQVVPGQLVAALGDREFSADLQGKTAAVQMALHDVMIAKLSLHQANQQVVQAQAGTDAAASQLAGARLALNGSLAQVAAARQQVLVANADLAAAKAQQRYSSALLARDKVLLKGGSISLQEFQKDEAAAQADSAKAIQQGATVQQATAMVEAAQANAAQARQNVTTLRAELKQASANLQAVQDGASTMQHEIIHKEAAVSMAQAEESAAAAVSGYTRITANIDGAVLQRLAAPGMLVQPGQPILQIAEIDKVRVQAQLPSEDLGQVHVGSPVEIDADGNGTAIHALVTSIFPFADPASRTATIEAVVNNQHTKLVPGQYVTMKLTTGPRLQAVLVPQHAIVQIPVQNTFVSSNRTVAAVWVMTTTGTAHMIRVSTGPMVGDKVAVTGGLQSGQRVIVEGLQGLQEGMPVVRTPWANGAPLTLPDPSAVTTQGSARETHEHAASMPGMKGMAEMGGM